MASDRSGGGRVRPRGWREAFLVTLGSLAFAALFGHPLLRQLGTAGVDRDWDYSLLQQWAPHETIVRYRQVPLWNPWACGGMPLLANPPSRFLTPWFVVGLLTDPVTGVHLEIVLHLAFTVAGGYVLGRVLGFSPLAAFAGALVFPACATHYRRLGVGHLIALAYAYLPWIAAAVWRALETRRLLPAALAGVLFALVVADGGVYAGPQAGLLVAMLSLGAALGRRDPWPLAVPAVTALVAFGVAAPKLLPMLALMRDYPRLITSPETMSLAVLGRTLFSHEGWALRPAGYWDYHEYGAYLGPCAAALALLGAVRGAPAARWWAGCGVVFLVLALGDFAPFAPWTLLHRLPVFASQHVPSRFLIPFVFVVGVLAGYGADALVHSRRRWAVLALGALTLAGVADAFVAGPRHLAGAFAMPARPVAAFPTFTQMTLTYDHDMFASARANRGSVQCYEALPVERAVRGQNEGRYRGEHHLTGPGTLELRRWTPNRLEYAVEAAAPLELVVNQNFAAPWTLAGGVGEVYSQGGLLAVRLPAGAQQVTLVYQSRPFWWGVGLAAASLAALAGWWWRGRGAATSRPRARRRATGR